MTTDHQLFKKRKMPTSWESLLLTADSDFVAYILLSHCGISESTSLWMVPHSIEKYLKSWLFKLDPEIDIRSLGHRLVHTWAVAEERFPGDEVFEIADYRTLIEEVNMTDRSPELRYSYGIEVRDPIFTRVYASLASVLRMRILGEDQYRSRGPFGLCRASFGGSSAFLENPRIDTKTLVCEELDRLLSR